MRVRVPAAMVVVFALLPAWLPAASDGPLIDAIKHGDLPAARGLLAEGVDVNERASDGATALHWASYYENEEAVELLLEADAEVNLANDLRVTPLWVASRAGSSAMVDRLLRAGADPDIAPVTGGTPLMLAVRNRDVASVNALIDHGANVNAREAAHDQSALMWAVARQHADIVDALLAAGADVHARSKSQSRVVLLCCPAWAGDPEGTVVIDQGGLTPLLFAALDGSVDSARRLLAAGADVDDAAAIGTSALVMAVHRGYRELATLLLAEGADPDAAGAGYTALHSAVLRGDEKMLEILLNSGADLNPRLANGTFLKRGSREYAFDKFLVGATPFLLAARAGDLGIMRRLAVAGADLSIPLEDGRTPLMLAAAAERTGIRGRISEPAEPRVLETVELLIELGADVKAVDGAGDTVVHVIARGRPGFDTVLQFLADQGAALQVANDQGQTPLMLALAPPAPIRGQSTTAQTVEWREAYAAWEASEGRTSTTDLLRKLGAQK